MGFGEVSNFWTARVALALRRWGLGVVRLGPRVVRLGRHH